MYPEQQLLDKLSGPIELKPGELARPIRREEMMESARALLAELPEPQHIITSNVESAVINPPNTVQVAPAVPKPVNTFESPLPDLPAQRAALNPLMTAAPVAPARPQRQRHRKASDRPGGVPSRLKPIMIAIATFSLMLFLFKLPVVFSQIKYLTEKPVSTLPVAGPTTEVVPPDPTITIPKINVHAPVVYEPSVQETQVQKALQSGIDHYGNTPAPGESGNSVFFGHSSNDWWEPGNYKFVFVLLDKLQPGDQFSIDYQSHRYVYRVTGSRVVEPTDLSVLNPTTVPTVTLITCTPPGTSWKRLVVTAVQIQPDPNKSKAAAAQSNAQNLQSLPGSPTSISDQFTNAVSGLWHGITHLFGDKSTSTPPTASPSSLPAIK